MPTVDDKVAALRAWLRATRQLAALSGDGWLLRPIAAEAVGLHPDTLRRLCDARTPPLRFRLVGRRWQVELRSIAQFLVDAEQRGESD
jgi:hypothetical protein